MTALRFRNVIDGSHVEVRPTRVLIAGFTGRDRDAVEEHIRELEAEGIPRPASVPAIYEVSPDRLTQDSRVVVDGANTSGEVEPVLVCTDDGWIVTVGSDHTDRDMERDDIRRSKDACPKPVGTDALPFDYVRDRWSQMRLRSWVGSDGTEDLYQDGPLSYIRAIEGLVAFVADQAGELVPGTFVFLGTVPLRNASFVAAPRYALELSDHDHGTTLHLAYDVEQKGLDR